MSEMSEMTWRADNIETVADFFLAAECDAYVQLGESSGFEEATMFAPRGVKDVRNNDRVIVDDSERAQALYQRLASHLAPSFQHRWVPVGLNERLRLYRYDVGQRFDWHRDGHSERENGERSQFTFMVYLNDDFEGGGTSFQNDEGVTGDSLLQILPKRGMALLLHHPIMHRGDPVTRGRKTCCGRT
jgi:2OG-Fe(II) oxygenase superfamily